jgi:ABC-type multidrug transport system fused ATPase/permease subunit
VVRSRVAVVGSVEETRVFDPQVTQSALARRAAVQLGRELANAEWDVTVYSSDPGFVEADVVRGYVDSGKAVAGSIQVRAPLGKGVFDEMDKQRELFDLRSDPSRDWEVSFYRSLPQCDGVLLIGGGRSTLVAGLIALTMRIPIIAVATFGGNAQKVWATLANERNDATEDDVAAMAQDWQDISARRLVQSLSAQSGARKARRDEELRQARRESLRGQASLAASALFLLAAAGGVVLAWGWRPGTAGSVAVLIAVPALAATAGALIRTSLEAGRNWTRAAVLGAAAGLITGLLFVASQLIGAPDVLTTTAEGVRRLLFFVLPIGFVAGLTFDAVYGRLRSADVSQAEALEKLNKL